MDKANRLLKIYSRIRRGPVTIEIIKDWCRTSGIIISERQLYRDLKEIENSICFDGEHVTICEGEKNRKVWKIEFKQNASSVSLFDVNTFYLFKNFAPVSLLHARESSLNEFEKLIYQQLSSSPFEKSSLATTAIKSSHFYEFPYQYKEHKLLEDCIWAIQNQRKFKLIKVAYDHTSLSSAVKFPLNLLPLQILYHRGCIHLCGLTEAHKKLVILALEQVCEYEASNDMFDASLFIENMEEQMNKRFGITENMNEQVYDIEIEFSEMTGHFVKNHFWHKTQSFERAANGNWLMRMQCGINRELVGWIFQWMSNARVLQPLMLRQMMETKLSATLDLYTTNIELHSNNVFRPA